ncbi:MAG: hypothetical protein SPI59_01420 [Finegoldia sp.]|nr:hypothetical protein [Finegoldia sp.]
MAKTSDAQLKASKKWNENNKERKRYNTYKSSARVFIRDMANEEDISQLEELIKERKRQLSC